MIFFAVMALYIVISVITYMRKDHIVGYQVNEGSLSSNNIYEALVIRKEEEVDSDAAGYVNYFQTEGSRVAVGNLVYTLDESGQLLEYLRTTLSTIDKDTERTLVHLVLSTDVYQVLYKRCTCSYGEVERKTVLHVVKRTCKRVCLLLSNLC